MLVHDHLIVFDIVLLKKTDLDGVFFVCVFVFVLFFLKTELGTAFPLTMKKIWLHCVPSPRVTAPGVTRAALTSLFVFH